MAAVVLLGAVVAIWQVAPLMAFLLSPVIYGIALISLRPFGPEELARIAPLLPGRLRRRVMNGRDAEGAEIL